MKQCLVDGCEKKVHAYGYCVPHSLKFRKYGDPLVVKVQEVDRSQDPKGYRTCAQCKGLIQIDGFYIIKGDRPASWCKQCHNRRTIEQRRRNPERARLISRYSHIKATYNLSREQYDELFLAQGESCAICDSTVSSGLGWHVDHDHSCCSGTKSCGKCVRGILCHHCNMVLGHAKDSESILRRASDYLAKGK